MGRRLLDVVALAVALLLSPWWATRMARRGKLRTDWAGRLGRGPALPAADRPRVLLHGVSVGEVNALRLLGRALADGESPLDVVVASTTDTGFARAGEAFASVAPVVRWPLDFSFAVDRFLDRVRPDAVVLAELEVWPGMTAACARRGIPVVVVNGRLTERSARRYARLGPLVRRMFGRLAWVAAQNEAYAARFRALGVPAEQVRVTGTMKWDTAQIADEVPGAAALAAALGIDRSRPLVVAGSTAPDEHELLRDAVPPGVQLLCAPRRPEWFDAAAAALAPCVRRSRPASVADRAAGRFLLDTIGELRAAYALADVVVIGRSFGDLHGSDMMEPVALGKPVLVGPAVADFRETVDALVAGGGLRKTSRQALAADLAALLAAPEARSELAERGRAVVRAQQGATARHAAMIRALLAEAVRGG